MNNPLSEDYLRWLAPQIRDEDDGNPGRTYWDLLTIMYEKEFVWLVPHDDNRVIDGLYLRLEFCHEHNIPTESVGAFLSQEHPDPPCSFLEVLIGLSRRLEFAAGGGPRGWAWTLMSNLELHRMSDNLTRRNARKANDILDQCIGRTYSPDGLGGFFPLAWPDEDQTKVELWYQMAAFIHELHPER